MVTILMQGSLLLLLYAAEVFKVCKLCKTLWQKTILSLETRERPENHRVLMISLRFIRCKLCKIERD